MTPAELARLLRRDPGEFNRRTASTPIDLRGADLKRAAIDGARLAGATLDGADLSDATLANCDLRDASLADVRVAGARIYRANLAGARLLRPTGDALVVRECSGAGATLDGVRGDRWKIIDVDLRGAVLRDVALTQVELAALTAPRARVERASFSGEAAQGIDLSRATIGELTWSMAVTAGLDLGEARIGRLVLRKTCLHRLSLVGATADAIDALEVMLVETQIVGAAVKRCAFVRCAMNQTLLRGSKLGALDLTGSQLMNFVAADCDCGVTTMAQAKLADIHLRACRIDLSSRPDALALRIAIDDTPGAARLHQGAVSVGEVFIDGVKQ